MIRTLTAGTALALIFAAPAAAQDAPVSMQDAPVAAQAVPTPTMGFGDWGVDTALLSATVDPGDDFFAYVNQDWLDANPLPPQYSRFGAFNLLAEKSTADVQIMVDELVASTAPLSADDARIRDAYLAYNDTAAIDAAGLAPAQPYLDAIRGAGDLDALVSLWAQPGYPSPLGGGVNVDAREPTRYSVYLGSGGLGLPDRDYYTDDSERGQQIRTAYLGYLTFLMGEAGYADPAATAQAVYDLETRIATTVAWDRATRRNRDLTYNALTPDQLTALAPSFPTATLIEESGFGETDRFVVGDVPPSAARLAELGLDPAMLGDQIGGGTPAMMALLADTPIETLQAWTVKSFLNANAAVLPTRIDRANFAFYGNLLTGTPEQRERWKRAIGETEGLIGELVGAEYVARHFPAENRAAMMELVENLRTAMAQSIDEIDWMGDATKREAMAKLAAFDPKIGYRDNLETYPGLEIAADAPLANRMAAARWSRADNLAKLGAPIDRTEWGMLPQTVNAYYNSTKNEIVFPAGILQQPFFALGNDPAVNYGAIGGVIGHEMGHGFDDQGSKSDGTGMLRDWWTAEDRAAFDARGDALVEQYGNFCPLDDGATCLNGRLTLGENIGDIGGLSLAWRAYKIATEGQDVPVLDGLTGDQRFFIAWAQVWRSQQREENARQRIRVGPHSLEEARVNGVVRNMDGWYEAFGVTPEDALYLPPERRVQIW